MQKVKSNKLIDEKVFFIFVITDERNRNHFSSLSKCKRITASRDSARLRGKAAARVSREVRGRSPLASPKPLTSRDPKRLRHNFYFS